MSRLGSGIPLVGRSSQLRRLRSALQQAQRGTAAAVLLAGDAGVGKSRMVAELSDHALAEGARVLVGRCLDAGETGLPYLPYVELLGQLGEDEVHLVKARPALGRLAPDLVEAPPHVSGADRRLEQDLGQLQLFDAVHGLITELATERCVVVVLEDLHWADSSTRYLTSFLLSRLRSQRVLVVATYRTDDLHRRHPLRPLLAELVRLPAVERLDLAPFDAKEARSFVAQLAERDLPEEKIAEIAAKSEGNAFFAEELVAAWAGTDSCRNMPIGLADVLLARVEALGPHAQQVVRTASVAGRWVRHSRLQEVCDLAEADLEAALREAVAHHVLVFSEGEERYVFRHALLREAVYGDLLPGERVRLHSAYAQRAAGTLDKRGSAAALAHHSLESHDLPRALSASVRAASEAKASGAYAEALYYYEQALKLWQAVPDPATVAGTDEPTLTRKVAYMASQAGEVDRAVAYARSLVQLTEEDSDRTVLADSLRMYSQYLLWADAKLENAATAIERAWELVRDEPDSAVKAWVLSVRSRVATHLGVADDVAMGYAEEALRVAKASGAHGAEADAQISLAIFDEFAARPEKARERQLIARDRAVQAGALSVELRAWYNLCVNLYDQGDLASAQVMIDEGAARAEQVGLTWSVYGLEVRLLQVVVRYMLGDWDGAEAAAELPGRAVPDLAAAEVAAADLHVKVGRGRYAEVRSMLRQFGEQWRRDPLTLVLIDPCVTEMELWRGRPAEAAARIENAVRVQREYDEWGIRGIWLGTLGVVSYTELAKQARHRGNTEAEQDAVRSGMEMLEFVRDTVRLGRPRSGQLGPEGRAWVARAEAEALRLRGRNDPEAWRETVRAFGYGHVYQEAVARWRLAEALLQSGDREAATTELCLAHEVAERLDAVPLRDALRQFAKRGRLALGEAVAQERPVINPLTPRERAVLDLVAKGNTNRQVGEKLYISEKTVSVHLTRIMAKLRAGSRTEAVAAAYERHLLT
ncbi:AAA family ATPase [Allokutzneria sp. A3M-2-11 16]|uniref:helix-turn-helix transcriptional regulator n=1 Tax=Allokutzneria sp. A3M-2-11 16 TaxID=2962043 RepID=UPI0020B69246|nr:AAA family ATPase [Allokutzneria sp. A3M-2-11 16]MCP3804228.1 AAA family ATPase [Allokutzneria sp. A3M-2-11 16]